MHIADFVEDLEALLDRWQKRRKTDPEQGRQVRYPQNNSSE